MWSARQDTIGMRRNSSSVNRCICSRYVVYTGDTSPMHGVLHCSDAERVIRTIRRLAMHRSSNGISSGSSSKPRVSVSLYSCECLFDQDSPGRPGLNTPSFAGGPEGSRDYL